MVFKTFEVLFKFYVHPVFYWGSGSLKATLCIKIKYVFDLQIS